MYFSIYRCDCPPLSPAWGWCFCMSVGVSVDIPGINVDYRANVGHFHCFIHRSLPFLFSRESTFIIFFCVRLLSYWKTGIPINIITAMFTIMQFRSVQFGSQRYSTAFRWSGYTIICVCHCRLLNQFDFLRTLYYVRWKPMDKIQPTPCEQTNRYWLNFNDSING